VLLLSSIDVDKKQHAGVFGVIRRFFKSKLWPDALKNLDCGACHIDAVVFG
jgi:hypothetical protein